MKNNLVIKEIRCDFEVKQVGENDDFVFIEGLASTFGNLDRDNDIIAKGAFKNTLTRRKPKFLYQHRMDQPIGVFDQLFEAEEGLRIKGRMPRANSMVKDIEPLLKMGALDSFSIGFNVVESEDTPDGTRIIKEIDLWEISLVTIPANAEAIVTAVKELDAGDKGENKNKNEEKDVDEKTVDAAKAESITTKKEYEQMLKDTGMFTKKASMYLASKFTEDSKRSDSADEEKKRSDSVEEEKKLLTDAMDKLKKSLT